MNLMLVAVGGVLAVIALALLLFGIRELYDAVRVYRGDPTDVFTIANDPGPVELHGVARSEEGTVTSPFSGSTCLICAWAVEQRHDAGEADSHWGTVAEGLRGGPFRLDDGTATCRVEPAGSKRVFEDQTVTVPAGTALPDRLRAFVDREPTVSADRTRDGAYSFDRDTRFVEQRLDVGEECYVYGRARYDTTAGGGAGSVNAVVDGDGIRRFVVADTRARTVAWRIVKTGLFLVGVAAVMSAFGGGALLLGLLW